MSWKPCGSGGEGSSIYSARSRTGWPKPLRDKEMGQGLDRDEPPRPRLQHQARHRPARTDRVDGYDAGLSSPLAHFHALEPQDGSTQPR
jgi:hypothetical protein